jgi:hypothetical protein
MNIEKDLKKIPRAQTVISALFSCRYAFYDGDGGSQLRLSCLRVITRQMKKEQKYIAAQHFLSSLSFLVAVVAVVVNVFKHITHC